jgi:multidrug efflux pump
MAIALVLVLVVIYLFLGNLRATLIPAVTIPISIIAAFLVMAVMGFSINVLTLLGLVLAIGLVVDDSIVVLENIYRRIEHGEPPLLAAVEGSREIAFAVIATTVVLVAVFVPISFLQGAVGRLFREFGFTIAAAVSFSALIALTLTPMMSSKLLRADASRSRFSQFIDDFFRRIAARYDVALRRVLERPWLVVAGMLAATAVAGFVFRGLPSELQPSEDRGFIQIGMTGPEGASLEYMDRHARMVEDILLREVGGDVVRAIVRVPGGFGGASDVNQGRGFCLLAPWGDRDASAEEIAQRIRVRLAEIPGVKAFVAVPGRLGEQPRVARAGRARRHRVCRPRAMARPADGPPAAEPGAFERAVELRGAQATAARRRRSRSCGRSRRVAAVRRAHARDGARLAQRHDVHRSRP